MSADLARDSRVARLASAPGAYTADLPESWSFRTPSGGVLMSTALRAMALELDDPALLPTSATALFCTPVPAGPLVIRVEVLRHGQAAAQLRAALSSATAPGAGLEVSATFAREREGPDLTEPAPPDVPRPEDAPPIHEPRSWRFFEHLEMRLAHGRPWWLGALEPGEGRCARWMRYRVPQVLADGRLDPFALPPIIDLMPTAVHQRLGTAPGATPGPSEPGAPIPVGVGGPRFTFPSLDLTVHFLDHTRSEWLLTDTHLRRARAGVASADVEVWDDRGRLVAYGTQTMILRRRTVTPSASGRPQDPSRG